MWVIKINTSTIFIAISINFALKLYAYPRWLYLGGLYIRIAWLQISFPKGPHNSHQNPYVLIIQLNCWLNLNKEFIYSNKIPWIPAFIFSAILCSSRFLPLLSYRSWCLGPPGLLGPPCKQLEWFGICLLRILWVWVLEQEDVSTLGFVQYKMRHTLIYRVSLWDQIKNYSLWNS